MMGHCPATNAIKKIEARHDRVESDAPKGAFHGFVVVVATTTRATLDTDTWMSLYATASSLTESVRSLPHAFLSDSFVALVRDDWTAAALWVALAVE